MLRATVVRVSAISACTFLIAGAVCLPALAIVSTPIMEVAFNLALSCLTAGSLLAFLAVQLG